MPVAGVRDGAAAKQTMRAALRDATMTFAIALALAISLVGLKTDTVNGVLELQTRIGFAVLLALGVAVARFLVDVFVWRPNPAGTAPFAGALLPPSAQRGVLIGGAALGLLFYFVPGLRMSFIEAGTRLLPLFGPIADLASFGCIAAFVLLVAITAAHALRAAVRKTGSERNNAAVSSNSDFRRDLPIALLLIAVLLPLIATGSSQRYAVDTATQILIYIMLGWGLNVVVGLAGLLDLGYVAFYAVGAYTYALISTVYGWSFWACLPLAGIFAALWGITLGFPVLRLRGDYLAIVTLAFGEIIRVVLLNWQSLTSGPNGINRIPKPSFFGLTFDRAGGATFHGFFGIEFNPVYRIIFLYYLILALALVTNFVTLRLRRLPVGRAWEALREDEIACRSLGINTVTTKLSAFAIGAMFAGFAGAFFAARQGFISPESFTFTESALVLAIVVLGGLGSQLGVVVAAVVLVGASERFRELQDYRMILFGLSMVLVMLWRPRGLLQGRTASAFLAQDKAISPAHVREGRG